MEDRGLFPADYWRKQPIGDTAKLVFLHEGDKYYLNDVVSAFEIYLLVDKQR
jgi:hypothetical protein